MTKSRKKTEDDRNIVQLFIDGDTEEFDRRVHDTVVTHTRKRALGIEEEEDDEEEEK